LSDNITISGIEKAVSALEYRNSRSLKYRLIHAIKQFYDSDQSLQAIDPNELVPLVWENVINPGQIKSKRKNLNSIRSSINSDLMKLFRDGKNPEGIIIDPSNVFNMCDEAKDAFLKSFTSALTSDEPITLDSISEVTRLFGEFLNKVPDDHSLEFVGSVLDALSSKKPLPIEKAAEVLGMFDNLITNMPDSQILKEHDTVRALLDKLADKAGWTPPAKASDDAQSVTVSAAHEGIDSLSEEDISKLDTIDDEAEIEGVRPADDPEEEVEYIESQEPEVDSEIVEVVDVVLDDEEKEESDEDAEKVADEDLSELDEFEDVEDDELDDSEEGEHLDEEDFEEVESLEGQAEELEADGTEGEDGDDPEEDSEVVEVLDVVSEDEGRDGAGDDTESGEDEDLPELDELEDVEGDELEESEEEEQLDDEDLEEVESLDEEEVDGTEGEDGDDSGEDSDVVEVLDVVLEDEGKDGAGDDTDSGEDEDLSELDEFDEVEDDELEESEEAEQLDDEELEEVDELDDLEEQSELDDEGDDSESDSNVVEVLDVMVDDEDDIEEVEVSDDEIEEIEDDGVTVVEEPGEDVASADFEGKYDIDEDEFDLEDLPETERKRILAERFDRYLGAMERHFNQFLLIPSGSYTIGSKLPSPGELPEQQIQANDFFMGKYPVINALFEVFVERTGYTTTAERKGFGVVYEGRFRKIKNEKSGQYGFAWNATHSRKEVKGAYWYQPTGPGSTLHQKRNHPVVQVSLLDAMAFASWVGKRLPTEAEWEAAARTDKGYLFPWGDDWKDGLCNTETSEIADTTPVDHHPDAANKMGIADLLGNILEWTSEKCDPPNSFRNDYDYRIAKGGSWVSEEHIQLASRFRFPTDFTSNTLGFRCLAD
jgi:formylglycine-generating enzyme required for sulfatase activity